jgi:AraC-like DNA-binding protein
LFRRLLIGRELLHSWPAGQISLAAASRAACLSPFHFNRGFTGAFQFTPHEYLTCIRLDRARKLIESGSSVLESCLAVASPRRRPLSGYFGRILEKRLFRRAGNSQDPAKTARSQ